MKKRVFIIVIVLVLLLALIVTSLVCRVLRLNDASLSGACLLLSEAPSSVKVAYFGWKRERQQLNLSACDSELATSLYQKLNSLPRRHSDALVIVPTPGSRLPYYYSYFNHIEGYGGTVQFCFDEPLTYRHSDICTCRGYQYAEATYNHIDLIHVGDALWVNFVFDAQVIATYSVSGSYVPSFHAILSTYCPADVE